MGRIVYIILLPIVLSGALTEEIQTQTTTVSETVDATLPEEKQIEKRSVNNFCYVNGRRYDDGHIFLFNDPCVKHRCENGVVKMFEDGCLYRQNKSCIPVNSDVEVDCLIYRCSKMKINYVYRNIFILFAAKCKDYRRSCREHGEVFPYVIRGRLYSNCVCYPVSEQEKEYECLSG